MSAPATWEIRQGDVLDQLRELPDESVHCCITSPPYYGLRDYGTGEWKGGDPECPHRVGGQVQDTKAPGAITTGQRPGVDASRCKGCGATRVDRQIGLEPTPDEYVARLVDVFAEVRRVLRDDGTLWLNLGDSYAGSWGAQSRGAPDNESSTIDGAKKRAGSPLSGRQIASAPKGSRIGTIRQAGCKPKDMYGIPWMVAFALRADGWYLRRDIIWAKPNPMPESTTDRPTTAHEYVFLLSKSPRYYYDAEAIREPFDEPAGPRGQRLAARPGVDVKGGNQASGEQFRGYLANGGRNKRSVWEIATRPYPDAHFATFPPKLIEPMVLAGAAPKCCGVCGAPWERETASSTSYEGNSARAGRSHDAIAATGKGTAQTGGESRLKSGPVVSTITTGWRPTCGHEDGSGRALVLDPFAGSGTTLQVALDRGRSALGFELNADYVALAERRLLGVTAPLFAEDAA